MTQAPTQHDVGGVEVRALVVAGFDRGGDRRLPATVVAALVTAVHPGERPATPA